jgi:hypothetical protein
VLKAMIKEEKENNGTQFCSGIPENAIGVRS